jgi:uncharacterized protein (TIGR02453 family)
VFDHPGLRHQVAGSGLGDRRAHGAPTVREKLTPVSGFSGFPKDALAFFVDLEANNERPWWLANKARFDASVAEPMRALLDELEPTYGTFKVFRMNRDVRFSSDKSPYKTAHAAMTETDGGSSHYVQVNREGLFAGAGMYHLLRDQLTRFREAVDDDRTGRALEQAVTTVRRAGLDAVGGPEQLASAPRGYDKDHPRIELLRWKGCIAAKELGAPAWLHTKAAAAKVVDVWKRAAPMVDWLDANVGPSELEPPARR